MSIEIPEKLSEDDARRLIEQQRPRYTKLQEEANKLSAQAQVAQSTLDELLVQAQARHGTTDLAEIERIGEANALQNSKAARAWLANLDEVEREVAALKQSLATPK